MNLEKVVDNKINELLIKIDKQKLPKHIAIIMDGNGRWATKKVYLDHLDIKRALVY